MDDVMQREAFGWAALSAESALEPGDEVVAGSHGMWRLCYVVGTRGIAPRGRVRIHTDSDTDWGIPQFDDPAGEDFCTIAAPQGAHIAAVTRGYKGLELVVVGRALTKGERVVLTLGDRSGGSVGSRAQTFSEVKRTFAFSVDVEGDGRYVDLVDSPHVKVIGGPAVELVAIAPSTAVLDQPFRLLIKAQDAWGNPCASYRGTVVIKAPGVDVPVARYTFSAADRGTYWIEDCRCTTLGVQRLGVAEESGMLRAESNPVVCVAEAGPHTICWGDPHGGQLVDATKIPAFYRYARDVSGISFCGYQPNAHRVSTGEWAIQQRAEREFYEPGRFVPLPGFEWSAETRDGGHHNVYFRRHEQPIRRSSHLEIIAGQDDQHTDLPHICDVHAAYRSTDTVITPHVGGGRADLSAHDPSLEPVIEVTSTHGTFEWFLEDALRRRYRLGFIGGSDGYTGRPGGEYPGHLERRFAKGGLTALYARDLTIEGVLEALKARRGYGTTGARMYIRVDGDGHAMGQEYTTISPPTLSATVVGTAPLESVELYRGTECVYVSPLALRPNGNKVRILWEGASRRTSYSGVIWDGLLRVSGAQVALQDVVRFDSPRSHVYDVCSEGLRWHSVTCGYHSGVVLQLENESEPGETRFDLVVNTSLITMPSYGGFGDQSPKRMSYCPAESVCCSVSKRELLGGPKVIEIGPLNRRLIVSLAPEPEACEVTFAYTDPTPHPGINAYWLRVIQSDMEMAWTSPVFVDYVLPEKE